MEGGRNREGRRQGQGGEKHKAPRPKKNEKRNLKLATWNKGGANQELRKKRNEIMLQLLEDDIDCLGVTEANLRAEADMQDVHIPGYVLKWDSGRENRTKKNARVVVYVKEELSCEVLTSYMKNDLMPEVWLRLGHKNTRRMVAGFVYREHTPWGTQEGSVKEQEARLQNWVQARKEIWRGREEVFLLGDINLDILKREDRSYRNVRMLKVLLEELEGHGWVQLIKSFTHYANRAGAISESLIDHVWTNTPAKVARSGQEEVGASDHHRVWVERRSQNLTERVRKTEKRSLKNFNLEDLEHLCKKEDWLYRGTEPRTERMLNTRVQCLEDKINRVLQQVAPMIVKKAKYRGRPKWVTQDLLSKIKERAQSRQKANKSKSEEDEKQARKIRNQVAKEVKNAEKAYLKKKLENLSRNSSDSWAAVGDYLGWRKPSNPTMLVQDGKVLTKDQELAEAMLVQYKRKEIEVDEALGEAKENYLRESRRMTKCNRSIFNFRKVTVKEVKQKIVEVDNKESFGHDKISYGFLKKMSKWIVTEIKDIINLSLEVKVYPRNWKIARVKPLYKGDGCDRQAPKSFRPVALLAAVSRITESLLARQLDDFQEQHHLVHKGVHGFRRGRGTNTAMLETCEYVLSKT